MTDLRHIAEVESQSSEVWTGRGARKIIIAGCILVGSEEKLS